MRNFARLTADQVDRQVRKALEAGCAEEAGELTMWFEQPEENYGVFAEAVDRLDASRAAFERLCAIPLSQRRPADNAQIRRAGNLWENTYAGTEGVTMNRRRKPAVTIRVRWLPETVSGHAWADDWMNEFSLHPNVARALTDDELEAYFRWAQHVTEGEVVDVVPDADTPDDDLIIIKLVHLEDGVAGHRRVAYNRMTVFGEDDETVRREGDDPDVTAEKVEHAFGNEKAQLPHPDLAAAWRAWEAAMKS